MTSLDFDKEKHFFRGFYSDNRQRFESAAALFVNLISSLTANVDGLEAPAVTARIKDQEECINKFVRKYQSKLEKQGIPYDIKSYISDLIGLRVTCYYETDISIIVDILRDNFKVIEETDKSAEMESEENVFGYKGHHLDLCINEQRAELPEYKPFCDIRFEVQVRSTIQDAWSALDHKIKYKKSIPHSLRRQINALAALFEIADREFTKIKDFTEEIKKEKAQKVLSDSTESSTPLDVFEFIPIMKSYFPDYDFDGFDADIFVHEINCWDPKMDAHEFKRALTAYMPRATSFASFQENKYDEEFSPFSLIRHALYLYDQNRFNLALSDYQRKNLSHWLEYWHNESFSETAGKQ